MTNPNPYPLGILLHFTKNLVLVPVWSFQSHTSGTIMLRISPFHTNILFFWIISQYFETIQHQIKVLGNNHYCNPCITYLIFFVNWKGSFSRNKRYIYYWRDIFFWWDVLLSALLRQGLRFNWILLSKFYSITFFLLMLWKSFTWSFWSKLYLVV